MIVRLERTVSALDGEAAAEAGSTIADGAPGSNLDETGEPIEKARRSLAAPTLTPAQPEQASKDRVENDGVLSTGIWTEMARQTSDEQGSYLFEGLDLVDDQGHAYRYCIRMDKPIDVRYVWANVGSDDNVDNDWAYMNLLGERCLRTSALPMRWRSSMRASGIPTSTVRYSVLLSRMVGRAIRCIPSTSAWPTYRSRRFRCCSPERATRWCRPGCLRSSCSPA